MFVMAARCVRPKEQGVGGLTSALAWVRGGALLIFWKGLEGPAAAWDRGGGPPARRWGGGGAGGFGAVEFVPHAQLIAVLASSNGGGGQQGSAVGEELGLWSQVLGGTVHCQRPHPTLSSGQEKLAVCKTSETKMSRVPECRVGAGEEADRNRPDELQSESGVRDQEQLSGPRGRTSLSSPRVAFISRGSACLF